jgi:hypothetical protein
MPSCPQISFDNLPHDIILAICDELELRHNTEKERITSSPNGRIVNGRRIIDDSANSKALALHPLIALSSINRKLRATVEHLLFREIIFGSKWEAYGEQRWLVAKTRMKQMLQKESLKKTVRYVQRTVYCFS